MLQLADVFEEFREVSKRIYDLDPAYYISAPQLSWYAILKITGAKIELIHDSAMFTMIDSGIRGGVSVITTRYAKANTPSMGAAFDPSLPREKSKASTRIICMVRRCQHSFRKRVTNGSLVRNYKISIGSSKQILNQLVISLK